MENGTQEEQAIVSMIESASQSLWGSLQKILRGDLEGIREFGNLAIVPAAQVIGILLAFYFGALYISKILSTPIYRKVDQTLGRFVEKFVFRGLIAAGFVCVLHYFGVKTTALAGALAAAGFAIGLAFQGTLSNFASGILLLVFRPFKVGDMVVAGGVLAKVHEIDLFTTVVDTPDNRRLIVPNTAIASSTIENVTYHPCRRVELTIGTVHSADLDTTRNSIQQAIDSIAEFTIQNEERKPQILLNGLSPVSVDWIIRVWAPSKEFANVRDKLVYAVKTQLDREGIRIAVPQMGLSMSERDLNLDGIARGSGKLQPRRAEAVPRGVA